MEYSGCAERLVFIVFRNKDDVQTILTVEVEPLANGWVQVYDRSRTSVGRRGGSLLPWLVPNQRIRFGKKGWWRSGQQEILISLTFATFGYAAWRLAGGAV